MGTPRKRMASAAAVRIRSLSVAFAGLLFLDRNALQHSEYRVPLTRRTLHACCCTGLAIGCAGEGQVSSIDHDYRQGWTSDARTRPQSKEYLLGGIFPDFTLWGNLAGRLETLGRV